MIPNVLDRLLKYYIVRFTATLKHRVRFSNLVILVHFENTQYGVWNDVENCPDGEHVIQFKTKNQVCCSNVNTALNGIELVCSGGSTVTSAVAEYGNWEPNFNACPQGDVVNKFTGARVSVSTLNI